MPQVLTEVVARPPVGAALLGYIEKYLRDFAGSIELARPDAAARAMHWMLLAAIVCGAAIVRFWGLGDVGLHGDEETMGMAVRGIVEQGAPVLPSGMFYPRALTQLYLMSVSVSLFGESEWALRLPSALCGIALVPICYVLGKRFLRPHWSLAFAASIAFLPELIVYSQTARMYVFLLACIAGSMACVFAWERTNRVRWLVAGAALLVPGLEMHTLAVASMLIFLFPGVIQGNLRKIGAAVLAMAVVFAAFVAIESFVNAQYPQPPADFVEQLGAAPLRGSAVVPSLAFSFDAILILAGLVFAYVGVRIARSVSPAAASIAAAILLLGGLALQLALFYHLAVLCYVAGAVVAVRHGAMLKKSNLIVFAAGVAAIALAHAALIAPSAGTPMRLAGAVTGQPSVWPYARIAEFSVAASLFVGALLCWGLYRIARGARAPDFWVFAILGVWCPLFALGLFAWDVPSRYTSMAVIPMLVCAFAMAQMTADRIVPRVRASHGALDRILAAVAALLVVNPMVAATTVDAGYRIHPDHKGAAEFMRTQGITDDDVVLAEDVLQQTYYLGRVDYWLIGPSVARRFVMKSDEGVVDFYTGTPVIVTAAMLEGLLEENRGKRIFIIGTGEGWDDGYRGVRGEELHAAIESDRFETLYVGRDGLTRVLRAVPGAAPVSSDASVPGETELSKESTSPEDQREIERALVEAPEG